MKIGTTKVDFKGLLIDGPEGHQSMELKIMALLRVLVNNAGQVMTRADLISAVWGVEHGGDESLSRGISILRKALGDKRGQHNHIVTVSRVGYRFIAEVSEEGDVIDLQSAQPGQVETSHIQDRGTKSNTAAVKVSEPSSLSKNKPSFSNDPIKGLMKIGAVVMACAVLAFLALSFHRGGETLSRQAKMERGFLHIENFTPKGAISEAQDIFSGILSDDPNHAAARAGLAFAIFREYTHLERDPALLQRAKAHAEAALRENEHLALANIAAAWGAQSEGNFETAHEYLDRADILDADNKLAIEGRYRTFGGQRQFEKFENTLNAGIQAYPNYALFYAARGAYFLDIKNDLSAAEADYIKSVELAPDNPRTYAALAHSLHSQDRTDEAVVIIQKGLRINETALLYNNLGTYLFFQGQYSLATSAFEKTLELSGDTHDYLYWANLGDAYRWSQDKKDQAATSYRRALQLLQLELDRYPNSANLKSRAAMFNAKLGNLDKAQEYMDSFDLTAKSPSIQLYRAVITYEIMSNRKKSLEYLEAAIASKYPLIEILNDPELARLRQDPDYHKLLAKTKKN